jgi:hypothetical protein
MVRSKSLISAFSLHLDRIECLAPLFEVVSSLSPMPFELKVDIYMTRSSETPGVLENLNDKQTSLNEKIDGQHDPESMLALPTLTRQSSNSDETSDIDKPHGALSSGQALSSLYTTHSGRPDVPAMVKAFGAAAVGESVAVAGRYILRPARQTCTDLPSSSLRSWKTQCRRWQRLCRAATGHCARHRSGRSRTSFRGIHLVV